MKTKYTLMIFVISILAIALVSALIKPGDAYDSDGDDPLEYGHCTDEFGTSYDYCYSSNALIEYQVEDNSCEMKQYNCQCSSGKCIPVDSDSGDYINVQGTCTIISSSYTDSCNGNTLTEYYSNGVSCASKQITCINSCSNGACVNQAYDKDIWWTSSPTSQELSASVFVPSSCVDYQGIEYEDYCVGDTIYEQKVYQGDKKYCSILARSCLNGCTTINGKSKCNAE